MSIENNGVSPEHNLAHTRQETASEKKSEVLSPIERKQEGEKLLADAIETTNLYLAQCDSSLQRFNRDFRVFNSPSEKIDYLGTLSDGASYTVLAENLTKAVQTFKHEIEVPEVDGTDANRVKRILEFIHTDLEQVRVSFENTLRVLERTARELAQFNGENAQVPGYETSTISYDMDALNTAIVATKDIAEASVRLDIDIYGALDALEKQGRKAA